MDLENYIGKRIGLVLTDENDESIAYTGWIASKVGDTLLLKRPGGELLLDVDWIQRIRPLDTPELASIVPNSDYWLPLKVGPNPSEEHTDIATGMKWPD
jgi:hypothetical protein